MTKTTIPRWKKWLSYLSEIHLESCPSEINPHLYVSLSKGKLQLSTENAIYSYDDQYDNYKESFEKIRLRELDPENVLMLGLGLGSVITILEKYHDIQAHITGVEIDENIVYLFNKYVVPDLRSPCSIVCANAEHFVEVCTERFDLICMDIFLDDTVPDVFEKHAFLSSLSKLLSPKGLLLYNRLASTREDLEASLEFFNRAFIDVFPQGSYLNVHENLMLQNTDRYNIVD